MTKFKLFHVVERKMHHAQQTFEIIAICEFDGKFDIWFNEDTISQTFSSYIQFDSEGYALSDTFYRIEIELLVFSVVSSFVQVVISQNEL